VVVSADGAGDDGADLREVEGETELAEWGCVIHNHIVPGVGAQLVRAYATPGHARPAVGQWSLDSGDQASDGKAARSWLIDAGSDASGNGS